MEVVGDKGGGGVRGGHELHAQADVLHSVSRLVLDDDAGGVDALPDEVPAHAFAFGEGFSLSFAAGHDTEGTAVLAHILSRRVEAVFEDCAGTVFADLGAEDDQVVQVCRRTAPEARQNNSLADEDEEHSCGRGREKQDPRCFGQAVPETNARRETHEKKAGAQGEPDGVKHRAAADQKYGNSVQNAQYADDHK